MISSGDELRAEAQRDADDRSKGRTRSINRKALERRKQRQEEEARKRRRP